VRVVAPGSANQARSHFLRFARLLRDAAVLLDYTTAASRQPLSQSPAPFFSGLGPGKAASAPKTDWRRIRTMSDAEIDASDVPELTTELAQLLSASVPAQRSAYATRPSCACTRQAVYRPETGVPLERVAA
jgi:hypothetical protein